MAIQYTPTDFGLLRPGELPLSGLAELKMRAIQQAQQPIGSEASSRAGASAGATAPFLRNYPMMNEQQLKQRAVQEQPMVSGRAQEALNPMQAYQLRLAKQQEQRVNAFNQLVGSGDLEGAAAQFPDLFQEYETGQAELEQIRGDTLATQISEQAKTAKGEKPAPSFRDKGVEKNYTDLRDEAKVAANLKEELQNVRGSFDKVYSGPWGEQASAFAQLANLESAPHYRNIEAFNTKAAVTLTTPLKGAISNTELALIKKSLPSLTSSVESNILLADIMGAASNRKTDKLMYIDQYVDNAVAQGKNESEAFREANNRWDNWVESTPILNDPTEPKSGISPTYNDYSTLLGEQPTKEKQKSKAARIKELQEKAGRK